MDTRRMGEQGLTDEMVADILSRARSFARQMLEEGYAHEDIVAKVFHQFGSQARWHIEQLKDNGYEK